MKQHTGFFLLALLLVACFAAPVHAQSELFPSTDVTARYSPIELMKQAYGLIVSGPKHEADVAALPLPQAVAQIDLSAIEPAAGHGEEAASEGEGHGEAKGESDAESEDGGHSATGKTEGKKSFSGKTIGAPPPLPTVTIGGQVVVTQSQREASTLQSSTPEGLKGAGYAEMMARRFNVTPYAHSPSQGDHRAPVQVLEFIDLSCGQCMPEIAKIDQVMAAYASNTYVVHIHAPTMRFQDTNMPAFYGKVAARGGVFWQFRANLVKDNPSDANAIFDELVKSGLSTLDARTMMLNEARRFYRELDADALLARAFGVSKPPVVFVNGIRLGEGGLPLEKLQDVMDYVNARLERGLPEPPK